MACVSKDREFGLLCPHCEGHRVMVYDSRPMNGTVRRLRKCLDCRATFETQETVTRKHLRKQHNSKGKRNESVSDQLHTGRG